MRRLYVGSVLGFAFLFASGGCLTADRSAESALVFGPLNTGEIRPAEVNVHPRLIGTKTTTKLEAKGSRVQVVHGLKRIDGTNGNQEIRLVVGAPSVTASETTGIGDLVRTNTTTPWETATFRLTSGVALASITRPPTTAGAGGGPGFFPPIMPVIIYEDIETGADGTLLVVWATPDDSTINDPTDVVCHVGLIKGGPGRIRLPDDGTQKNIRFTGAGQAIQVHISDAPSGAKRYVVRHAGGEYKYNNGAAGPSDDLVLTGKPFASFTGLADVVARLESVIESLRLE